MSVLRFSIRAARKSAHISGKLLRKSLNFTNKVEHKATNLLDGVDYSIQINEKVPLEKIYYNSIPYVLPIHAAMPAVGSKGTVTLLIPSLDGSSFFGGTATALVVAAKLALLKKCKLRIVQTLKTGHPGDLVKFFTGEGITISDDAIQVISIAERSYNVYGYISTHPDDIFIASAWWDAYNLSRMPLKRKFIYLVQDFEPIFYNNSDRYVLAEETYKNDKFIPLCNTKFMADFMSDRNYPAFKKSLFFEPAVSRKESGTLLSKNTNDKKTLFLYGRPNVHRNMFFTALQAIDHAFKAGFINPNNWDCYMAGQNNLPDIVLSSGAVIKNKGKMSMEDYIEFSKTVDLAISPMMAPHPNYPTLEFSSIGSMVVTTKYANKKSLDKYSKNIIMSELDVESMAGAINIAVRRTEEDRLANLNNTNILTSWDESLDDCLKSILDRINKSKNY